LKQDDEQFGEILGLKDRKHQQWLIPDSEVDYKFEEQRREHE